jgi:DNA-binding NarL/FixJ family response regulator
MIAESEESCVPSPAYPLAAERAGTPAAVDGSAAGAGGARDEGRRRHGVALIDELPLRRACTLNLLRQHVRESAVPFRSVTEFLLRSAPTAENLSCVLISIGGRSLAEAALAEQIERLNGALATPIVVLSDREEYDEIVAAFRLGVRGFIPGSLEPDVAIEALRLVQAGGTYFPASALIGYCRKAPVEREPRVAEPREQACRWPPRQLAVLRHLVQGKANKEIARALKMEESTVKVHVWHIMKKLDAANRTEAALRAHELGILPGDQLEPAAAPVLKLQLA